MKNKGFKYAFILGLMAVLMFLVACSVSNETEPGEPDMALISQTEVGTPAPDGEEELEKDQVDNQTEDDFQGNDERDPVQQVTAPEKKSDPAPEIAGSKDLSDQKKDQNDQTSLEDQVIIRVTRDFGRKVIFDKVVPLPKGSTVMDLLEANLDITTQWDGGFVKGINGLESEQGGFTRGRSDWFFYMNGISADGGAAAYTPESGEAVWWDYHLWKNMGSAIPAIIGNYPEPFKHGFRGERGLVTVAYASGQEDLAQKMVQALKNQEISSIDKKQLSEDVLEKRAGPVLILGVWQELDKIVWLKKFNDAYRKTGTGVHFSDKGVELFTSTGELGETAAGSVGVIMATGEGLGDSSPLWLVTGTDEQSLKKAVGILTHNPEKISGLYQAAVVSGEIKRLPLEPN